MTSILVVDDSSFARMQTIKLIKDREWSIVEANNGKDALDKVSNLSVDCILLDLTMPEMDGRTFLHKLREQNIKVPVIVVTADTQDTTRRELLEWGVKKVFNKPIKGEELIEAILDVIS